MSWLFDCNGGSSPGKQSGHVVYRRCASTTDQIEGKLHEIKGKVKEAAGRATNNPNLTNEGHAEKLAGKVQEKIGQVKKVFEK